MPTDVNEMLDSLIESATPWLHSAAVHAQELQQSVADTTDVAVRAACDQIGGLQDASTTHYYNAMDTFSNLQREYKEKEEQFFHELKEGVKIAADNPGLSAAVATGVFFVALRRPRRFLWRMTLGRFDTGKFDRATDKMKDLTTTIEMQNKEKKKLEERFWLAEEEFLRGKSKMENAGNEIHSLYKTYSKTEKQTNRLLENLRELGGSQALHMRQKAASLAATVKEEKATLDRHLRKIANHIH